MICRGESGSILGKPSVFLENKYYRWYLALVARDDTDLYTERHHKIPKALGGSKTSENIVRLSARKHFLAHWLLTKCTSGAHQQAMLWALACMSLDLSGKRSLSSWRYARARQAYQLAARGRIAALSPEQRQAYSDRMLGKRYRLGQSPSSETREKLSAASKGNKSKTGMTDSVETRISKRLAQFGRPSWSSVGLKGVFKYKVNGVWDGRWGARIKDGEKQRHLGLFTCPAAAHLSYVLAVYKHLAVQSATENS